MLKQEVVADAGTAEYRRALRAAVARDLHDGPIQSLTESIIRLERYRTAAPNRAMQSAISDVEETVRIALMSLRHMISDLRDQAPNEDVAAGLRAMAARFQASTGVEISVVVSPKWPSVLPAATAMNLIRIAQEAITNAIRHGRAETVLIELVHSGFTLGMTVSDDGCGMPSEAPPGSGLVGMRERTALLGGRLAIRPRDPGTEIRVEIPGP